MIAVSFSVPEGACDCHIHAYDEAYPLAPTATFKPPHAPMVDYAQVQAALGLTRVVVVQPTGYGFDNRCTLAAVASMHGRARGVAMVPVQVADSELQALHAAGVRGVRMMMFPGGLLGWDALAPMADKVRPWGWHLNVQFNGCEFVQRLPLLQSLNVPLVIDHTGKFLVPPAGTEDPAFQALCWTPAASGSSCLHLMRLRARARRITMMWVCWRVTWPPITPSAACGQAIGPTPTKTPCRPMPPC